MSCLGKRKITVISLAFAALISGAGSIYWLLIPEDKPPAPALFPVKSIKYMASRNFSRLSMDEKQKYLEQFGGPGKGFKAFRKASLTECEKQALRKNISPVMQKIMRERLKDFFKLSKTARKKRIKEIAARINERRRERESNELRSSKSRERWHGDPAKRIKRRMEEFDSATRAQFMEFRKLLRAEMQKQKHR
ncbi:hypothetical protein P0136_08020 [Lentisphaerota bacterium ZTH]|nr:hypothetical protein JYG24_00870 [Lentisphaerota bacterium]WET05310.1 hypothetical protein P0136_08020 [Lentisphaerota bacterium ZTH]